MAGSEGPRDGEKEALDAHSVRLKQPNGMCCWGTNPPYARLDLSEPRAVS